MNPSQEALNWLVQGMTPAAGPLTFARALALQRQFMARQGFVLPPTLEAIVARLFGVAS
jgi:hypothetical protein